MRQNRDMQMTISSSISRRRWLQSAAALAAVTLLAAACGRPASGNSTKLTKLELGCDGDSLAYDKTTLAAPAGGQVELTFHNRSAHHQHNWLLVNGGEEVATKVYEAALAAGVKQDFLPPAMAEVVAFTPLLASGQSATVTFQAPAQSGSYLFLCTFPGHFLAGMRGMLEIS